MDAQMIQLLVNSSQECVLLQGASLPSVCQNALQVMPSAKGALPGTSTSSSPSLGQLITTLTCTCVFWLPDKHVLQIKAVKCSTVRTDHDGDLRRSLGSNMCKQGILQFLSNAEMAVISCVKAAGPCKWLWEKQEGLENEGKVVRRNLCEPPQCSCLLPALFIFMFTTESTAETKFNIKAINSG